MKLNILCIGDIVGRPGKRIVANQLADIVKQRQIDCVIANGENAAGGSGLTPQIYEKLLKYGVHLITLGDHSYRKKDIIPILETKDNIARPANFSPLSPGKDFAIYQTAKGPSVAVIALVGRMYMKPAECPYNTIDKLLGKLSRQADIVFVDFHAEATSEKVAMGYHLDGKVSCVFGTHTHVATADEKILSGGTAYITDIGMTGAHDSVLGRDKEPVLKFFRTQMPSAFGIATGDVRLNGIIVQADSNSKKCELIERIQIKEEADDTVAYDSDDGRGEHYNDF